MSFWLELSTANSKKSVLLTAMVNRVLASHKDPATHALLPYL